MPAPVSSLIPTVQALRQGCPDQDRDVLVAVWDVLTTVDDPRGRRGRRHQLATVLVVALAAVLGGAKTLAGIADWAADQPGWTLRRVGVHRGPPSLSTIRRVLVIVDTDVLDAVLHAWLAALAPPPPVPRRSGRLPWMARPAAAPSARTVPASLQAHLRQVQVLDLDRVDDAAWSRESWRRLQSMEAVAANYLSGGATHVIDPAAPDSRRAGRFPGLGPALAAWDVQAHRSLTSRPTPANLQTVCVTQAYVVGRTAAVVGQAAQRGVIDARHDGLRLQPALAASAHAWEDQHRHWRRLLPRDGRAPDPNLALAAARLRHELQQLTDPRREANPEAGQRRSDRDVAAALTHHAGISLDLAYVTADIATDEDSLRVGAWYVAKRIGQARDAAQDAEVPEPHDHHLTARQVHYNEPVPLPAFIRHELTDAAVATVQTSLTSASAAAVLDYCPALPTAAVEPAARTPIYDVFTQDTLWDTPTR